jgi:hypothetical protein
MAYAKGADWPFVFDSGRLVVLLTPQELSETSSELLRADERHIPTSMEGGVLFDGQVLKQLPSDRYGQPRWLIKPLHFLLGREKVPDSTIEIISPKAEAGGVVLDAGAEYRIFTINLEGRFYAWKGVVAKLSK